MNILEEEKNNILEEYKNGKTLSFIMDKYGVDFYKCKRFFKKNGVQTRSQKEVCEKYPKKENIFEEICCEESAYFLGLLLADGCILDNGLVLSLKKSDIKILNKLKKHIYVNESPEIKIRNRNSETWNSEDSAIFTCKDVSLSKNLQKFGCYKTKSTTAEVKTSLIAEIYFKHVVRGFFDGDGSICKPKDRCWVASFCTASEKMVDFVMEYLNSNGIDAIFGDYQRKSKIYYVSVCGREALLKFFEYIYKDCSIYLDRKFLKFIDFLIYREKDILIKTSGQRTGKFPCFRENKTEFIFHYAKSGKDFSQKFPKSDFTKDEALLEINSFKNTYGLRTNPENLNWPNYADLENLISPARIIRDLNITLDDELKAKLREDYNISI